MLTPNHLYAAVSLSASLLLLGLSYRALRQSHRGKYSFIALMSTVAIWSLFYAVELLAPTNAIAVVANRIKFVGIALVPVAWVVFAGYYSRRLPPRAMRYIVLLLIIPLITIALAFTSPQMHQLLFTTTQRITDAGFPAIENDYGIWWPLHVLYSYLLIVFGSYWMVISALQSLSIYKTQARLILLAVIVPLVGNMLSLTDASPLQNIDLAPTLFSFSALIFAHLLQQQEGMSIVPISYQSVIDNLPNAVMVLDDERNILAANRPLRRLVRRDEKDLIGKDAAAVFPEAASLLYKDMDGIHIRDEIKFAGRYIDLMASSLTGSDGNQQGMIIVMQDITVRKQTELALMSNERRYRALFENSNDAIFIMDLDFTIIIANIQAADMLRVGLASLLHTPAQQYLHPDERQTSERLRDDLINGAQVPLYERTFIREDGSAVPCEVSLTLVRDAEGSPLHIQMIVRDISERRKAEKTMAARIEQMAVLRRVDEEVNRTLNIDVVVDVALEAAQRLSGADAGFIALNDDDIVRIARVTGGYSEDIIGQALNPNVGLVGRVLTQRKPELVRDATQDIDYYADLPNTMALMALPLVSHNRLVGIIVLETRDRHLFDENKFQFIRLLAGRLAVAVDNARLYAYVRHQLDESQELYEELRNAEKLKTDMIRIANHDLQNPLAIIAGYLSLLEEDREELTDEHTEFFDHMKISVERMRSILHDFLSVESIQQRAKNFEKLDLLYLVRRAYDEYRPQASMKGQAFQLDTCNPGEALIMADEPQMYQALTNLMGNAIKYTPDNGRISIELSVNDDNEIVFAVQDTGYGIPEDRQSQLFQPFYRTRTDETSHIEGTGLGLHLVKRIVERHKGEMIFNSVHGEGSLFGFKLPPAPQTQPISEAAD